MPLPSSSRATPCPFHQLISPPPHLSLHRPLSQNGKKETTSFVGCIFRVHLICAHFFFRSFRILLTLESDPSHPSLLIRPRNRKQYPNKGMRERFKISGSGPSYRVKSARREMSRNVESSGDHVTYSLGNDGVLSMTSTTSEAWSSECIMCKCVWLCVCRRVKCMSVCVCVLLGNQKGFLLSPEAAEKLQGVGYGGGGGKGDRVNLVVREGKGLEE